jgi:O-antigen/teichoic acid export membrane protein
MTGDADGRSLQAQAAAGAVWTATGMAVLSLCGYLNSVMLARGLGPAAFGVYGVVYSLLLASEQVLRFGIPQSLAKLINSGTTGDVGRLEATGVWIVFSVNLAAFALLWAAAPWLADWLNLGNGAYLIRIAILDLPFFGVYRVLLHIFGGRRNFRASGIATCIYATARAAGIAVLLALDSLTIQGALIANAVASLIGFLVLAFQAGPRVFRPTLSERSQVTTTAIPITVGDVAVQGLLSIDLWLLSAMGVALAAGVRGEYVAALSLARGPNLVSYVLVGVLVPLIALAESSGRPAAAQRLVTGATRMLVTLVLPACALMAANAGDLMVLFFGEGYREGALILALLSFAQGFGFTVLLTLQAVMIAIGMAGVAARHMYVALAAALLLNVTLIPQWGATGAALAAMLSLALANLLVGRAIFRKIGALLDVRRDLLAVAAASVVAVASWFIRSGQHWVLVEMAALALVYLALAWWLGLVGPADIALLRGKKGGAPDSLQA